MTGRSAPPLDRSAAEDFLYREATLLDAWALDEWVDLFASRLDATYWVTGPEDDLDPSQSTSIIYDDRHRLEERVWRLQEGPAHAQIPRSVTSRMVSNVTVLAAGSSALVSSNFVVHEVRKREFRAYAGRYQHTLELEGNAWRIAKKKVSLANGGLPIFNLTFIL